MSDCPIENQIFRYLVAITECKAIIAVNSINCAVQVSSKIIYNQIADTETLCLMMTEYYYFDRIRKRHIGPLHEMIESRSWRQHPSRLIGP